MIFGSADEVLDALVHAYYVERNAENVISCVTDNFECIGTESNEFTHGREELRHLLEADVAEFPEAIAAEITLLRIQSLGDSAAVITVKGRQSSILGESADYELRGTLCCVRTEKGWLASNLHISVPNSEMEKMSLRNALKDEQDKQKALLENVPGGVAMYRVKKDGRIATDYVSDSLARICGYDDSKDIMRIMEYDSRRLVLQEDFPIVARACRESLRKGVPTSVNYRIHGKDGSPVRITLDSVVMKNTVLGEDDVAVFYAVQTLVSDDALKAIEEQQRMSRLMDSVPAGLGIFEIQDSTIKQVYINDAFFDMIGSTREKRKSLFGQDTIFAINPNDFPKIQKQLAELMDGQSKLNLDFRMKNDNGQWIWLHSACAVAERKKNYLKLYTAFYECTESKQQQLMLLQNQRAVELAQNEGNLAIWIFSIDRHVIIQQTTEEVNGHLGYPEYIENAPQCFVEGKSIHPDDVEKYLEAYKKLENGADRVDLIYRLINRKSGEYNWVHMFYRRMENSDASERVAVGFSIVINKQQEAIERYHVEQKLREQMYSNAVMFVEYNLTRNCYEGSITVSEKYRENKWANISADGYLEQIKASIEDKYVDGVTEKLYSKNLLSAFERGENKVSCEYRSRARKNMPITWFCTTATMVRRPDTGDVMAFICVENIEKKKRRQLALESSMSDGIENVVVIRVSDGCAHLIHSSSRQNNGHISKDFIFNEEFVRKSGESVVDEEREAGEKAAALTTIVSKLERQDIYQYSVSVKESGGEIKRHLFRFRYLDDRKNDILLSISDITSVYVEEQAKKKQLSAALSELKKASSAKAEFYSRMSHDMRTPMNGILGMAELSDDEADAERLKENIGKIRESGKYLLSLINDTLDLQRIESGKMVLEPRIVSTMDVVENILDMVGVTAKAKGVNIKFCKGNADLDWYIRVDDLRLKQIFINLLSNAIKFTPANGTVELKFKLLSRQGMISHDVIYVRDTGVGMSREFLENGIFKPFSQENNAVSTQYAGSGLGLSIAKSLIELMNGRIEVESELGIGTTFSVYIDFERVEADEAEQALNLRKKIPEAFLSGQSGRKILLAEDHPLNAEIAQRILKKAGYEVTWVKNGQEAVDKIAEGQTFDAVLMDIRMPVMDGLEATRQIRALDSDFAAAVPIIAMTANAYEEDIQASLSAGMNAHLGKPIEPRRLYDVLEENILKNCK